MKRILSAAVALLLAKGAVAHELGTPFVMPSGATIGVPVGANPPPGIYFSARTRFTFGHVYNGSATSLPITLNTKVTALQFHWVPGTTMLGGTYRAMVVFPLVKLDQTAFGAASNTSGLGDVVISPINLSWMVKPGIFVGAGLSFNLPTGSFSTAPGSLNVGTGAYATQLNAAFSYLRNGWNLSADANFFVYAENHHSKYRSGNELLVDFTAMRDLGGFSLGPVGYLRRQLTSDVNKGAAYGGATQGRANQFGLGIGFSKRFGRAELNINYVKNIRSTNTLGEDEVLVNFTVPIGGK